LIAFQHFPDGTFQLTSSSSGNQPTHAQPLPATGGDRPRVGNLVLGGTSMPLQTKEASELEGASPQWRISSSEDVAGQNKASRSDPIVKYSVHAREHTLIYAKCDDDCQKPLNGPTGLVPAKTRLGLGPTHRYRSNSVHLLRKIQPFRRSSSWRKNNQSLNLLARPSSLYFFRAPFSSSGFDLRSPPCSNIIPRLPTKFLPAISGPETGVKAGKAK